jgi:hypothetical protein
MESRIARQGDAVRAPAEISEQAYTGGFQFFDTFKEADP